MLFIKFSITSKQANCMHWINVFVRWDKKSDIKEKEKKKKKTIVKSEGGSQEALTENGKDRSRKSSVCDSEATENKKDHSRESSICDRETSPLSGFKLFIYYDIFPLSKHWFYYRFCALLFFLFIMLIF